MRSWRPFCCGWPGLMRSMAMPRRSHQTESLERLNRALGLAKGTPLSERMAWGRPRSWNSRSKAVTAVSSRVDFKGLAQQQEARGMVGDGQRVAVAAVAELELALEVGAPQIVGRGALGQRRAARAVARPAAAFDQAVAIENRMDGALGWNPDIAVEPPDQELADLARAPMRLLGLQPDDQALDLLRQLVGVAHRPARPVAQGLKPMLLVAIENLVAGLAGYAEIPADVRHGLPVQQTGDKAKALFHHRTRFPRHQHLPPAKGEKCYPCVRYGMSPMSRAAHFARPRSDGVLTIRSDDVHASPPSLFCARAFASVRIRLPRCGCSVPLCAAWCA